MKIEKVVMVYRNKWGELNKLVADVELPATILITPVADGKNMKPRRVKTDNIAEMDFTGCDAELAKFKKQYK